MMFLYAVCGDAIGAALRYLVSITLLFPFGTLAVNGIGSFFMGALLSYSQRKVRIG